MYFNDVSNFNLRDVMVTNITKSKELLGNLRVIKFDSLKNNNEQTINHINITNFTYTNSEMSFFDLQGS